MAAPVMLVDGNSSRTEVLKGVIAQKLSSVAQEIFAVIERTVAAYEEEATGLKQEIDRQKSQLGILLQLKLEATDAGDGIPFCKPAVRRDEDEGGGGGGGATREEEQQADEPRVSSEAVRGVIDDSSPDVGPGVEVRGDPSPFNHTGVKMEEDDEEEEEGVENLTDPEEEEPERLTTPSASPDRITESPLHAHEPEDHINLRIRILEDSEADLTNPVLFRTCPLEELKCPLGRLEADFFSLLRSSFPQLAAWTHFDFFVEEQRRLRPLQVKLLTPEEIYGGTGPRTIYIRPTNMLPENIKVEEEMFVPPQRPEGDPQLAPYKKKLRRPTGWSERVRPLRKKTTDDIYLKIRILDHLPSDAMISPQMFKKAPAMLHCSPNMQEADFLKLLRSSVPQLADQSSFDFFKANKKRKLQPIVGMLKPAELSRFFLNAILYIHPKAGETTPRQKEDPAPDSLASDPLRPRLSVWPGHKSWRNDFRKLQSDTENYVYFQMRILDLHTYHIPCKTFKKFPVYLVRCPRGLQENQFLDLLRSAFPQLSAHASLEFFLQSRFKQVLLAAKTPEEIQELMNSTNINSLLYVKPTEQDNVQSGREETSPTPDPTDLDSMDLEEPEKEERDDQDDEDPEETDPEESDTEQPVTAAQSTPASPDTLRTAARKSKRKLFKRRLQPESDLQKRRSRKTRKPVAIPSKRKQQFMCNYCDQSMHSFLSLSDHLMSHSGRVAEGTAAFTTSGCSEN